MKELENSNAQSIYLHIPFCIRKCNYCAFTSFTNISEYEELYINALCEEISAFSSAKAIDTVYFGGGTPNLLTLKSFEKIFEALNKNFHFSSSPEITVEINPALSDLTYFKKLRKLGANRLSVGVQTFNDKLLKTLNRIHNAQDSLDTLKLINNAGFENHSIDLIYGIFGQTLNDIKKDLIVARSLNSTHISAYGLKIEENTPFEKFDKKNLPNDELCEKMYLVIDETLENAGFNHYEISNFAKENYQAIHNLTYWKNKEYYGFGAAAHGYLNKIRYKNSSSLNEYIKNPKKKEILNRNTMSDILEEEIFLGLRLKEGINLCNIKDKFEIDFYQEKRNLIEKFVVNNLMKLENNQLSLTVKGFLISNYLLGELLA